MSHYSRKLLQYCMYARLTSIKALTQIPVCHAYVSSFSLQRQFHTTHTQQQQQQVQPSQILSSRDPSKVVAAKYIPIDKDDKPSVIYIGALKHQIRSVKLFSLSTSVMGFSLQPIIYTKTAEADASIFATIAAFSMIGFFTYVTPLLIHYLAKRYVYEIVYDPKIDTYTAASYSFFLRRNEIKFKVEDIIVPDVPGPFSSLLVKNNDGKEIPLFILLNSFIVPSHYGRFMGYDKPLDLHLEKSESSQEPEMKTTQKKKRLILETDIKDKLKTKASKTSK